MDFSQNKETQRKKKCKYKDYIFILFTIISFIFLSTSFLFQSKMVEVKATTINSDYLVIATNINQTVTHSSGASFKMNGSRKLLSKARSENIIVTLTTTGGTALTPIYNAFFFLPDSGINTYAYACQIPDSYKNGEIASIAIHLTDGTYYSIRTNNYPTTFNLTIDIASVGSVNVFNVNCSNQTYTTSFINNDAIYNILGNHFLNTYQCSGRGDSVDENNLRNNWPSSSAIALTGVSVSKLPELLTNYLANYCEINSSSLSLALQRYDYIVFYKYQLTDYLNRSSSTNGRYYLKEKGFTYMNQKTLNMETTIIIVSSLTLLLSTSLLVILIRKRMKNQ